MVIEKAVDPARRRHGHLIVEDSNVNGHPVAKNWGAGPFEAMEDYFRRFPNDYVRDTAREQKFAFTFATHGFLKFRNRQNSSERL